MLTDYGVGAGEVFAPENDGPSAVDDGLCGLVDVEGLDQAPECALVGEGDVLQAGWIPDDLAGVLCVWVTGANPGRVMVSLGVLCKVLLSLLLPQRETKMWRRDLHQTHRSFEGC